LLAQLEAFLPSVRDEVDWVDFTLLSWIRCFEPTLYAEMPHRRDFLLGGRDRADSAGSTDLSVELDELYTAGNIAQRDRTAVDEVLHQLFPNLDPVGGLTKAITGRVNNIDYFDRFFAFGVPADDLPDSVVTDAYRQYPESETTSARLVRAELIVQPRRTASKIIAEVTRDSSNAAGLASWLIENADQFPSSNSWFSSASQADLVLSRALASTDHSTQEALAQQAISGGLPATFLLLRATDRLLNVRSGSAETIGVANAAGKRVAELLKPRIPAVLTAASQGDVFEEPDDIFIALTTWERVTPGAPKEYIAARIHEGRWTEFDVLARLVGSGRPIDSDDRTGWLDALDVDFAGKFIDVAHALASMPDTTPPPLVDPPQGHSVRATPDNRRAYLNLYRNQRPIPATAIDIADADPMTTEEN
jgi:hypothetical protein